VSRSLGWLLDAPYDVTPATVALTSVAVSNGQLDMLLGAFVFAGSGSGVIATSSVANASTALLAGSGSGVIATMTTAATYPVTGTIVTGSRDPFLDTYPALDYPNWVMLSYGNVDNGRVGLSAWPFTFYLAGTGYTSCFIASNGYITFGAGSFISTGLSASVPALPKVMFGSDNLSYQTVYFRNESNYVAIRWEGCENSTGASPGLSTRVVEITFWKPGASTQLIEVRTGIFAGANSAQPFLVASASASYASATTLGANQNWVFEGNLTGTSWTLYSNSYVYG